MNNLRQPSAEVEPPQPAGLITRRIVARTLGEAALTFLETVRGVPAPSPEEWGNQALAACRQEWESLGTENESLAGLSKRQWEVAVFFARHGKPQGEIANILNIGVGTVKTHLREMYGKLGIHSRKELLQLIPAAPADKEPYPATAWAGLGGLALEAYRRQRRPQIAVDPLENLTERRQETVMLLARHGKTYEEIAEILHVKRSTIQERLHITYRRLGLVHGREELTRLVPVDSADHENVSLDTLANVTIPQAKILGYVWLGENNQSIAEKLGPDKYGSPKDRLSSLYSRLGVRNKNEAIRVATLLKGMAEQSVLQLIGPHLEHLAKTELVSRLDTAEAELLALAGQDKPGEEIAREIGVTAQDIDTLWDSMQEKLGVKTRAEAIDMLPNRKPKILGADDFYSLSIYRRKVLSGLSRGLPLSDIAREIGVKEVDPRALEGLRETFGIRTAPILELTAAANREAVQAAETSLYHRAGLTGPQIAATRLAIQGLSYKEIDNLTRLSSENLVRASYKKLGVKNAFQASLLLDPPGRELVENLELSDLSDQEEEIFLSMADNPTNNKLAAKFFRSENNKLSTERAKSSKAVSIIAAKLKVKGRLQVARLAYAHRLYAETIIQERSRKARQRRHAASRPHRIRYPRVPA